MIKLGDCEALGFELEKSIGPHDPGSVRFTSAVTVTFSPVSTTSLPAALPLFAGLGGSRSARLAQEAERAVSLNVSTRQLRQLGDIRCNPSRFIAHGKPQ